MNRRFNSKKNLFFVFCSLFFVLYWLILIRPAWTGKLGGTFKAKKIPQEYIELKDFINGQDEFFRTFWVPKRQRFGFYSNNHPAIDAVDLLKVSSASDVINWLQKDDAKEQLSYLSVKYVIIPFDSEKEIFLKDRKYEKEQRANSKEQIAKIKWLRKIKRFGKIDVFETSNYRDRFWIDNKEQKTNLRLKWEMVNPVKYIVKVENDKPSFILFFSENFNKNWIAKIDREEIYSQKTFGNLNSFEIKKKGSYNIEVYYKPQTWIKYGAVISTAALLILIIQMAIRYKGGG